MSDLRAEHVRELILAGDMRNLGRTSEALMFVLQDPSRIADLVEGLTDPSPLVRGGCANLLEAIGRQLGDLVQPYGEQIVASVKDSDQKEVQWHAAQMVSQLSLDSEQRAVMAQSLLRWFDESTSSIVRTMSLQGLSDLAELDPDLQHAYEVRLMLALECGTPAMKARARKLATRG